MKIELIIDGKETLFTTDFVPMLAKRKYMKLQAKAEKKIKENNYTSQDQLDEEDELVGVLANVIFKGQFTPEQVYEGATDAYVYEKIQEAVFGKQDEPTEEAETGNNQGE